MIIAVVNQKGGVGKTTTTLNLGAGIAREGYRVLLTDLDFQRDLMAYEAVNQGRDQWKQVKFASTDADSLHTLLQDEKFDFALLDCSPSLGEEVVAALRAADVALVPVAAEFPAVRGLARVLDLVAAVRRRHNSKLRVHLVVTMLDGRSSHGATVVETLRDLPSRIPYCYVHQTVIGRSLLFARAAAEEQSIFEFAPSSPGATAYRDLAREVIENLLVSARADTSTKTGSGAQKTTKGAKS